MWWGLGIIGVIIWIAIAFLARQGCRPEGTQLHRLFPTQYLVLPTVADYGVRGGGPFRGGLRRGMSAGGRRLPHDRWVRQPSRPRAAAPRPSRRRAKELHTSLCGQVGHPSKVIEARVRRARTGPRPGDPLQPAPRALVPLDGQLGAGHVDDRRELRPGDDADRAVGRGDRARRSDRHGLARTPDLRARRVSAGGGALRSGDGGRGGGPFVERNSDVVALVFLTASALYVVAPVSIVRHIGYRAGTSSEDLFFVTTTGTATSSLPATRARVSACSRRSLGWLFFVAAVSKVVSAWRPRGWQSPQDGGVSPLSSGLPAPRWKRDHTPRKRRRRQVVQVRFTTMIR